MTGASPLIADVGATRSGRFEGKAVVLLALLVGFGFGALLAKGPMLITSTGQEPAINMALKSTAGLRSFRPNALSNPPALTSSGVTDIRDVLRYSAPKSCIIANKYATVCGDLVYLRPMTAVGATSGKPAESELSVNVDELIVDLKGKVDSIEDKPQAAIYAGVAVVGITVASGLLTTIDSIPLLPKLLELIGTGYSAWFAYRYLLNPESRKELTADIEAIKSKTLG